MLPPSDSIVAADQIQPDPSPIAIPNVFRPGCIELLRDDATRASVIKLLVRRLADEGRIDSEHTDVIVRGVLDRESLSTTAVRKGIAIPHLRTADVEQFVGAIGFTPNGIDFGALDNSPSKLILLTLSPLEDRGNHCELLSNLFSLTYDKSLILRLNSERDPKALYRRICGLAAASEDELADQ